MNANKIEELLKTFRWETLQRIYGCGHSSIIGFISTEWINLSPENSILDGAPSANTGKGRTGQKNADLILCKVDSPLIAVEVETLVDKYDEKLDSLFEYMNNKNDFNGIEFGLLFMTNLYGGVMMYKHNWEKIKERVKTNKKDNIALVSVIKERACLRDTTTLNALRKRNGYSSWDIKTVDYWIYSANPTIVKEGNIFGK